MFDEVKKLNKRRVIKLAAFSVMAIGIVLVVMVVTVKRPKESRFCANCHNSTSQNISFNIVCKKALLNELTCNECHNDEKKSAPLIDVMAVKIKDEHCTSESCHPLNKLSARTVQYKKIKTFEHKSHIGEFSENFKLRCTSCHANVSGEKHFDTDEKTCNTCHFIDTQKPLLAQNNKPISDCTICHICIEKTKEIYGKTFRHDVYERNEKVSCSDCHFETIRGNGKVEKENCYKCHLKVEDGNNNISDMHYIHTHKHKTACMSCHTSISHGWTTVNNEITRDNHNSQPTNSDSQLQKLMMTGMGGAGVKGDPDPMYLATLNCSACHKDKLFTNVKFQVCNNCHSRGFDKILFEQKRFVSFNLQLLKTLLIKAKRYQDVTTDRLIQEAEANYDFIKKDGSFGVHNIKYVKDLLGYSIGNLKRLTKQNSDILSFNERS